MISLALFRKHMYIRPLGRSSVMAYGPFGGQEV
jgi:hypothetical protein